ncbi:glycosyltransferase family 1 protein [Palleronia sediminis]|uniref:Glycosyltransferase family 1 protein n=1 Tax=Palleronia sediminis TaxID=2547833 RepID=A0A4V3B9Z2_9RHOB|nr:glycosyltransferase family 1 protein [Palleronia sediminis]TDL81109.1 glycosyltransferase family 1 protein [Palleronia sediminis]
MGRIVINGKFLGKELNGVHRTAAHFANGLIARAEGAGHDVRLLAPAPWTRDPAFEHLRPETRPGLFGGGQGWEMATLPRLARGALLVSFCNLGPVLHRNSVVMIHDAQTFMHPEDYSGRQAAAYRMLLPVIGRRAKRVLTVSDYSRKALAAHGVAPEDRIAVVHNGTDHMLGTPPDPDILERHGLAPGGYVLALGSGKGYKNIRMTFAAMAAPAPGGLKLAVAGGPADRVYRARGWIPPEGTVFTGFVSDAELRALYQGAAAFLFPSLTEGFGLPPVEAMQCGAPVLAARAGAMPEICGAGAVLLDPNDGAAWRAALSHLLADPAEAAALRARGTARAAALSWEAAGDRLWSVLEDLVPE